MKVTKNQLRRLIRESVESSQKDRFKLRDEQVARDYLAARPGTDAHIKAAKWFATNHGSFGDYDTSTFAIYRILDAAGAGGDRASKEAAWIVNTFGRGARNPSDPWFSSN
jgi:hypothetical protein